jgi:hypothetical protein
MRMTPCECSAPGFCARHQCEKDRSLYELCRRNPEFYAAWERGELRPGQQQSAVSERLRVPCRHRQSETREVTCPSCRGQVRLKVFGCNRHGECTVGAVAGAIVCCLSCLDYDAVVRTAEERVLSAESVVPV